MNRAVVGLGSNIDPDRNIAAALEIISQERKARLLRHSSLHRTAPVGYADQPDFLNGAALLETDLNREQLTRYLHEIEQRLGRVRTAIRYGPRTIDLDIVVWNGTVVDKDYTTRNFLRATVNEVLPEIGKTKTGR